MNVSFDNLLLNAILSATNEDINKPVTNLIHNFLELAFYSTGANSVITIILNTTYDIDHVAYGFHNLNSMQLQFYDSLDVLLDTENVVIEENETIYYFDIIEGVKRIVITCSTLATLLYIGSIFLGEYLELPHFQQSPASGLELRDSDFTSPGGQSSGNRRHPLESHNFILPYVTNAERLLIIDYLSIVQKSIPHFIDAYPDVHSSYTPFYGKIISSNIPMNKRRMSNFKFHSNLSFREAR